MGPSSRMGGGGGGGGGGVLAEGTVRALCCAGLGWARELNHPASLTRSPARSAPESLLQ